MIMQPEWISEQMVADAAAKVSTKKPAARVDEAPVLAEMHNVFIPEQGMRLSGTHHEVYFSDPRRGDPAKRRTLLRQPVTPVS